MESTVKDAQFLRGEVIPLNSRGITEETCAKYGYQVGWRSGKTCQIATYKGSDGKVVGQKLRFKDKEFSVVGTVETLFGQHLFRDGGKMVTITEGEIDALSVSQAFGNKYPVVSIPTGAKGAVRAIRKSIEWLEQFETVVFFFDNDSQGRDAANECALQLSPGKSKIVTGIQAKDANELLVAGNVRAIINAVYEAKTYRPDGVVLAEDLWDKVISDNKVESIPYPWTGLNDLAHGIRRGELVTLCGGTGIGKSLVCREIANWLLLHGHSVGYIALEESVEATVRGFMSFHLERPPHKWDFKTDELKEAFDNTVSHGRLFLYDHWGSIDPSNLLAKIRFMVKAMNATHICVDHLSIILSALGSHQGDERKEIDRCMTLLRSLVEELKCSLFLVSHLKRPEGRGHEEGASTSLGQLRGSHAIAQLSDMVFGLERDQQAGAGQANITTVRVLKNRYTGQTGRATELEYVTNTGRLREHEGIADVDASTDIPF